MWAAERRFVANDDDDIDELVEMLLAEECLCSA